MQWLKHSDRKNAVVKTQSGQNSVLKMHYKNTEVKLSGQQTVFKRKVEIHWSKDSDRKSGQIAFEQRSKDRRQW